MGLIHKQKKVEWTFSIHNIQQYMCPEKFSIAQENITRLINGNNSESTKGVLNHKH